MIKKVIAVLLIIILMYNFFAFMTGKISELVFWMILGVGGLITYFFFPKDKKVGKKRRK